MVLLRCPETPEIGAFNNEQMRSISAYIDISHEELRLEDYELLEASSFPSQNQGNAFQQSSSQFGPHTCPVPSSQSSTGGAFSSSPTDSVLLNFRTSTLGSPSTVSTSPSFYTSNNPVSTTSGFSFASSSASSTFGIQASSGSRSTISFKCEGSRVASYSATTEVEKTHNLEYVWKFQSISAMPSYNDKSHEELRLEDYGLGDKGGQVHCGFPFHTPPLSNQTSVSPFQPFKSTFSELERGNSVVTPSNTISTAPTISPFVNPFPLRPVTDFSRPTFTSNWNPPSLIPCSEPMRTKSFEFPKTFPSSSVETFSFSKPSVIFSPSIQSTPATSSDSSPSIVAPSQPQQTAEKVGFFPIIDLKKSSQGFARFSALTNPWKAAGAECRRSKVASYSETPEYDGSDSAKLKSISAMPHDKDRSHEELRLEDYEFLKGLHGKIVIKYQGSRLTPYSATTETEIDMTNSIGFIGNIQSISAVPSYNDKSHEELRFEDHRVCDKVNESQPQQAAERSGSLPTDDLHKKSQDSSGLTSITEFTSLKINEQFAPPSNLTMQSPLVVNPFATRLPVDQPNALTSRLHGISSLPVSDNLSPNRRESLLRIRHASSSLPGLPTRKPNGGKTKVPFFIDEEDKLGSVAPFMPKENPRGSVNVSSLSLHSPQDSKDEDVKKSSSSFQLDENSTRSTDETASQHDEASASTGRYVADVLTLLPKLQAADYYTKPSLLELAAMETAEAGFCSHVKDFVVGRKGYGSIKFIGETDVRHLDIESIVQFKDRGVTVYPDEGKKPRVGQQLNKEAEVTLLNVKCRLKNWEAVC